MSQDLQTISSNYVGRTVGYFDFIKGFKSALPEWQPFVDNTALYGRLNTTLLGFNDPKERINFASEDDDAVRRFLLSMVKEPRHPEDKRIFGAHSWGATRTLGFLCNDDWGDFFSENYDGIVLAAPFTGSHFQRGIGYGPLARAFSRWNKDEHVGSTALERAATKYIFKDAAADFENVPIHAQSLYLDAQAVELLKHIERYGISKALRGMPITIMIGERDKVCKNAFVERLSKALKVEPDFFNADHYLLLNNATATEHLFNFARSVTPDRRLSYPMMRHRLMDGHNDHHNQYFDNSNTGNGGMLSHP